MQRKSECVARVLVIENDLSVRMEHKRALQLAGIKVVTTASVQGAQIALQPNFCGVILASVRSPLEGVQVLKCLRSFDADLPVILIADGGDGSLALEAMRSGAYDCIEKPFSPDRLIEVVKRALEMRRLTAELETLRRRLCHGGAIEARLIGSSPQMETVRRRILDVAESDDNVLVIGETGTGKDLVARCIHDFSSGERNNFVALDCRGLPQATLDHALFGQLPETCAGRQMRRAGEIERANDGTLFLDHIEALPVGIQAKLLCALRERVLELPGSDMLLPLSIRVIVGGRGGLERQIAEGHFSSELYHLLSTATIELPPLHERRQDIPALYDHFLLMAAKRYGAPAPACSPNEVGALLAYHWPGNVSELRYHADCRALGVANCIGDAGAAPRGVPRLSEAVETFERTLIAAELERNSGNISRTSEALGVARTTLHDKMRKYGLNPASGQNGAAGGRQSVGIAALP